MNIHTKFESNRFSVARVRANLFRVIIFFVKIKITTLTTGGKGKAIKLPNGERLTLTQMEMRGWNFDTRRQEVGGDVGGEEEGE